MFYSINSLDYGSWGVGGRGSTEVACWTFVSQFSLNNVHKGGLKQFHFSLGGNLSVRDTLMRGHLYLLDNLMIIITLDDVINSVHEPAPLALVL